MLYLIKSYGPKGKSILKIGFTDRPDKRFGNYFYHNPYSEVISTREGDENLESLLHFYLKSFNFQFKRKGKLDEWFVDIPEVRQIFHISQDLLERKIWKFREKMFNEFPNITSTSYKIFKYLWSKNNEDFIGEEFIVEGKR